MGEGRGRIPVRSRTGENPPYGILEGEEETRVPRVHVPGIGWTGVVSMARASSLLDGAALTESQATGKPHRTL
jgi:hypothetical protein